MISLSRPQWRAVKQGNGLCPGDRLRVGANSRAGLYLTNNSMLRLNEFSTVTFTSPSPQGVSGLSLEEGIAHFISRLKQRFEVITPYVNSAVEGTEFVIAVGDGQTQVTVFEGQVRASNEQGEISLSHGETALALSGKAPVLQLRVHPWDAVSWAMHYPVVTDFTALLKIPVATKMPDPWRSRLADSLRHYHQGNASAALADIESLPADLQNGNIYIYRAALYLAVGQAAHASTDLKIALKVDSGQNADSSTKSGEALALQAIIAVVQNQTRLALKLARQATGISPDTAGPWLARSYAQQAAFDLDQARLSVEHAVNLAPESALAWARLAELHLMFGELDQALQAARRAADIAPRLAQTQSVLGFAYLTRIDMVKAEQAFNQAILFDQTAPLPRLGLGLAIIRRGELAAGRHQIEVAASLDPANSLIRSYLGKAYYEEKRDLLAADQLAMARQLDPNDPTPYFYNAIRRQTDNDPVGALEDLNKSIELNNNRAVYRSRLLLDQDQAMRSTNLASVYTELGMDQLALSEASKSLSLDPSNSSAHRFLADSYAMRPRHEVARVSELLQAQLLQPVNINSVQPHLAVSDLNIVSGRNFVGASGNEFTQLFERNAVHASVSAIAGSDDTIGEEIVLSGIHDKWSFSFGQLHTETDGFRENNDVENDIYSLFSQIAISSNFNLQAEYIRRETDQGDLVLGFDLDSFSADSRRNLEQDIVRLGGSWAQSVNSDTLFSLIYTDTTTVGKLNAGIGQLESLVEDDGYQYELQHLLRYKKFGFIAGLGSYDLNVKKENKIPNIFINNVAFDRNQKSAYIYMDAHITNDATVTAGLSYDKYEEDQYKTDRFNPKLGLQWNFVNNFRLRAAGFKTTKRALAADRTLEKTSVAGFNQFFDDPNGSKTKFYGAAVDGKVLQKFYLGIDGSRRKLDVPISSGLSIDRWQENSYRSYFNWVYDRRWSLGAELKYEKFEIKQTALQSSFDSRPQEVVTRSSPLSIRYHHPNGLFSELVGTYYDQEVTRKTPGPASGSDNFFLLDAFIGYRFKKRLGLFRVEFRNIKDENFQYQDDNFRTTNIRSSTINPTTTILGVLTIYL